MIVIASFRTLALVAALAAPSGQEEAPPEPSQAPQVAFDDLVIRYLDPEWTDVEDLFQVVQSLAGRSYHVAGRPLGEVTPNLRVVNDMLQVIDTAPEAERILDLVLRLDVSSEGAATAEVLRYQPRHVSAWALVEVARATLLGDHDVNVVSEESLIVARVPVGVATDLRALFAELDQPAPQVQLTAWVLQPGEAGAGAALPADLVANLGTLLPGTTFRAAGFALLQTTTRSGGQIGVRIEGESGDAAAPSYLLQLVPVAFDPTSGSLAVDAVELVRLLPDGRTHTILHTSTVLRGGEYTVLGATGAEPVLLAVRLTPV